MRVNTCTGLHTEDVREKVLGDNDDGICGPTTKTGDNLLFAGSHENHTGVEHVPGTEEKTKVVHRR